MIQEFCLRRINDGDLFFKKYNNEHENGGELC